jgi:uncharacterized iron-regulated membrane protein
VVYGDAPRDRFYAEVYGEPQRLRANVPSVLAAIDPMLRHAQASWGPGVRVGGIDIAHPDDAAAVVTLWPVSDHAVVTTAASLQFDGRSGAVQAVVNVPAAQQVQGFFDGLHRLPFAHWWLRWLYFAMGLASCVMIATGLMLWVDKRRARQGAHPGIGWRVVQALAVAGSAGLVVATLAMLVANKLLPLPPRMDAPLRALAEQVVFFAVWLGTLAHALWRSAPAAQRGAWCEQAWAAAALALTAVLLNAAVTGDHVLAAAAAGQWAVAGTDAVLLGAAAAAAWAARRLRLRHDAAVHRPAGASAMGVP